MRGGFIVRQAVAVVVNAVADLVLRISGDRHACYGAIAVAAEHADAFARAAANAARLAEVVESLVDETVAVIVSVVTDLR